MVGTDDLALVFIGGPLLFLVGVFTARLCAIRCARAATAGSDIRSVAS